MTSVFKGQNENVAVCWLMYRLRSRQNTIFLKVKSAENYKMSADIWNSPIFLFKVRRIKWLQQYCISSEPTWPSSFRRRLSFHWSDDVLIAIWDMLWIDRLVVVNKNTEVVILNEIKPNKPSVPEPWTTSRSLKCSLNKTIKLQSAQSIPDL